MEGVRNTKDRLTLEGDRRKLQNDVRTSLLQGLGGAALVVGLIFAWIQFQASQSQLSTQQDLTRRGQIADRFTRAVDQLGNAGSLDVRLGGIYSLEQVARESHDDRARLAVYDVLTAYIRRRASVDSNSPGPPPSYGFDNPGSELQVRSPDVQAAVTVLGCRDLSNADPPLDLHYVDLGHGDLSGKNLAKASLWGAHLTVTDLRSAHLEGADLAGADLSGAILHSAHLEGTRMWGTKLEGAILVNAHIERANLQDANLSHASLFGADLGKARYLERATLAGARANTSTVWPAGFNWRAAGVLFVDTVAEDYSIGGPVVHCGKLTS